jgi:hypothetical protein
MTDLERLGLAMIGFAVAIIVGGVAARAHRCRDQARAWLRV